MSFLFIHFLFSIEIIDLFFNKCAIFAFSFFSFKKRKNYFLKKLL